MGNVRLPLYAAARADRCAGRWLEVGPLAWVCSDGAELSADEPWAPAPRKAEDGLPYPYFFVRKDGAEAFLNIDKIGEEAPEEMLDPGFAVAVVEERDAQGERWGRTRHGKWVALRELAAVHGSPFQGEVAKPLDVAWVVADTAPVYAGPAPKGKPRATRPRFTKVAWREERAAPAGGGPMVRVSDDGASPEEWLRARDLAHPTLAAPPEEIGGGAATEKWIDVELASQVLVAYDGARPVFATLVSTGKGAPGSETATPPGAHRLWVKLASSDMDNLDADPDDETSTERFSLEDVPYVQFFDRGIALHGAFWHNDFGRPHSHGCVNLAPRDAAWLFAFTAPHLPAGWTAAFPTDLERGTLVRVR
jgi:lipoprotein-anchoring transpeptidase ErfK/SrfK